MQFYIEGYASSHGIPEQEMNIFPHISLVTDRFDDYGYETLFRMYYKKFKTSNYIAIGKVKILNAESYITREKLDNKFDHLSDNFCSLGQSVEYYSRLRGLNRREQEIGREILSALNDIAVFKDIEEKFPVTSGVQNSLLRDSEAYHAYRFGHNVYYGVSSTIKEELSFTFTYNKKSDQKVSFLFNDAGMIPNRINVIVGKNGTGKTKALSSLASILSGYSRSENCEVDNRPEFSRYIAISYSAFDNFYKPFDNEISKRGIVEEKIRIYKDIEKFIIKCKSRIKEQKDDFDILYNFFNGWKEETDRFEQENDYEEYFDYLLNTDEAEDNCYTENRLGSYVYCGLKRRDRIVTEDEMFSLFISNLEKIIRRRRKDEWYKVITEIFDDELSVISLFGNSEINEEEISKEKFSLLSSGQKIIIYIFTEVIESITNDSLLLIDEPEIHLHPNAISNFMRMLNKLLVEFNSYAIISTHSPIILQEVPSKYVRIFDNNKNYDTTLYDECFGENISKIISNVFDVRADESNYKSFFIEKKREGFTKEEITGLFENSLSMNARFYLNYLFDEEG